MGNAEVTSSTHRPSSEAGSKLLEELAKHPHCLNFSDPTQSETHLQAFLAWLPKVLHDAPGIDWKQLPGPLMGYLIRTVAQLPEVVPITLAIGCAVNTMKSRTLLSYCQQLTQLIRKLRTQYGLQDLAQLGKRQIWDLVVAEWTPSLSKHKLLAVYDTLTSLHLRGYLEGLTIRDRAIWEAYAFPPLPAGFLHKHGQLKAAHLATRQRRREQVDVLVPLFPLLVELAYLRKQAAERLVKEFRRQRARAEAGEIELPHHFQYTDHAFTVSEDAATLADVKLIEREVVLPLTLWDRITWVEAHLDRYGYHTQLSWKQRVKAYAPENNLYFLQHTGEAADLLWCGDLIANRKLGNLVLKSEGKRYREFSSARPGLLTPLAGDSKWLRCAWREGEMLFEPESLYRGALYACALASLALTNGSRVSELLQVSASRFETLVVDELKNQQPTGRKMGILVQNLLPKGSRHESERQFFLIGDMAGRLLREIGQLLETTHQGMIPTVFPYRNNKAEDLLAEPYLFQWAATDDGSYGMLSPDDVCRLLRFLFYGLTLTTRTGKPIRVATHLLRHVMATHTRTIANVPAEAVAYLLHHRVLLPDGAGTRAVSISEATAYYSSMTTEQLLAMLFEAQSQMSSTRNISYLQIPSPRSLEQMDAALRAIFERWGMIGPTALGHCSAGLCIRPNNRALCLDCPYLVPYYRNLPKAKTWRQLHVLQARLHDEHGHTVDAQQARQMIQRLDDIITIMQIQIRTRQDGGYLPFVDTLLPAQDEEGSK
jgi:hypothetical protein